MAPIQRLTAPPPLPRWLSVTTIGAETRIVFEPDGRVVWRARFGPHGIVEKATQVDGEMTTRTTFHYDAAGHLQTKHVVGPGLAGTTLDARYVTDDRGCPVERGGTLFRTAPDGSIRPVASLWRVRWGPRGGARATLSIGGDDVRRDTFDPEGRLLRTDILGGPAPAALVYVRTRSGRVLRVDRTRQSRRRRADPTSRDPHVRAVDVASAARALLERHEVLLLLGSPVTHTDAEHGVARTLTDDFSDGCFLNAPSTLRYDATGLVATSLVTCICGFCVDPALPTHADHVRGRPALDATPMDSPGPSHRRDGRPSRRHTLGPRPAGSLRAGDVVLDARHAPRVLRSVEQLPAAPARLGRNLRTDGGTFSAGGVLLSESPRPCLAE